MKAFILVCIFASFMAALSFSAQASVYKSEYLEVTCTVMDSTNTSKEVYAVNEPATYVLSIRNVSDFPISYRLSSENSSLFDVSVKSYYSVKNEAGTFSSSTLDSDGVLEAGEILRDTKTVSMDASGKYEFVVEPNFNFPKQYWPSTGPLYRVFTVVAPQEEK